MKTISFFLLMCLVSEGGNYDNNPVAAPKKTAASLPAIIFSYKLFPSGNGFGFDICKYGKQYIHQPFIPMQEGFRPFSTKRSAEMLAILATRKLSSGKFRFLFKEAEIKAIIREDIVVKQASPLQKGQLVGMGILPVGPLSTFIKEIVPVNYETLPHLKDWPVKQSWKRQEVVPFGNRSGVVSFSINENIYLCGGQNIDQFTNELWEFNTKTGTWTCLSDIPLSEHRSDGVAFALLNKGYWGLGAHSDQGLKRFNNDLYQYDPTLNKWFRKKNFPGSPRVDACAFTEGDKGYVGGGYDEDYCKNFYQYDPTNDRWKKIADFSGGPISSATGISLGKRGFVVAGDRLSGNQKFVYEYVAENNKWVKRKDLPGAPRYYLVGCNIDSNFFIAGTGGAKDSTNRLRDFYIYDASKDKWFRTNDYPVSKLGVANVTSINANGKLFFGTGFNGNYLNEWNEFKYYFNVRTDAGDYNETIAYPLKYNGQWELFEECNSEDCFAGIQLKTNEQLGNFLYGSRYVKNLRMVSLKDDTRKKLSLFPRNFTISTEKQPRHPVSLRLFYTKDELNDALGECSKKTRAISSLDELRILQCNETNPDTDPSNNSLQKDTYSIIKPKFYSYGYNGDIIVVEFPVTSLHSEFYLAVSSK